MIRQQSFRGVQRLAAATVTVQKNPSMRAVSLTGSRAYQSVSARAAATGVRSAAGLSQRLTRGAPKLQLQSAGSGQTRRWFTSYPPHTVVNMPALSPTMDTGSISKWNLQEGDKFEEGAAICEVETDKATVTFDAQEEGYIAKILASSGEIKVGQPIMVSVENEGDVAAFKDFKLESAPAPSSPPKEEPKKAAAPPKETAAPPAPSPTPSSSDNKGGAKGDRIFASPLAKKLAREAGMTIEDVAGLVSGSGPNGRLIAEDVMKAAAMPKKASDAAPQSKKQSSPGPSSTPPAGVPGVYEDFELSDLAQSVANRLTHAKQVVPHYYLSIELDLTKLLAMRESFNKSREGDSLSVLDFMVKAAALAMKQVPDVNGSWMDTFVRRYEQVDINLVMGTGSFLVTPVVRDAGAKGLSAISAEIASFEDSLFSENGETRDAALSDESKIATGTFSIHNLGMFGVKSAAPIVLPPQACGLSLGAIVDSVVPATPEDKAEEAWKIAPVMVATLSCDHRVVDGAVGAQWLSSFKQLVENPNAMLL